MENRMLTIKRYLAGIMLILSSICLIASQVIAAPSVTTAIGSFRDGDSVAVAGTSFGSGPSRAVWLGGKNGMIESAPLGDLPKSGNWDGWDRDDDSGCCKAPEISSLEAHSGGKSIYSQVTGDRYDSGFFLDWNSRFGSDYGELFMSHWKRWQQSGAVGSYQWKMVRFATPDIPCGIYCDHVGQIYTNYFAENTGWSDMNFRSDLGHTNWCSGCGDESYFEWVFGSIPIRTWVRDDYYIKPETADNANDGHFVHQIYNPSAGRYSAHDISGNADIGTIKRRYIIFQNYFGNLEAGARNGEFYIDDIYIADSRARIEICAESSWNARKHCEIQMASSWTDSSVTFAVNSGSLGSLNGRYLFVVDSHGTPSGFFSITDGSCIPDCAGKACGSDGCSGNCGSCQSGQSCSAGICSSSCSDECASGQRECSGAGYRTCGNYDADLCMEWSAVTACPANQYCAGGICSSACSPSWTCTPWSACLNSMQTRVCTDSNACGSAAAKPEESRSCTKGACPDIKFQAGDRVKATTTLNVRAGPGTEYAIITTRSDGDLGTISAGPDYSDPDCFYQVDYDTGTDGWSYDGFLDRCVHKADSDCFGCITQSELLDFIQKWKSGQVGLFDLMEGIRIWKSGC